MTPLSDWVVKFAVKLGEYMDQPGSISAKSIESFQQSPLYHYDEAKEPSGGFKTYNKLFSRHLKKGMRPISCPDDDSVVVYPADSMFDDASTIMADNIVSINEDQTNMVDTKTLQWPIQELLADSKYAKEFTGRQFIHSFLNTFDYHRQHAPVGGTVVEANLIQGLAYPNVLADAEGKLHPHRGCKSKGAGWHGPKADKNDGEGRELYAPDNAGYQFLQTRGCVIIKNELLGYVAALPIGMAQVSSVKLRWKPGSGQKYPIFPNEPIKKGDEISHFEFGGSDMVLVFQKHANLKNLGATGVEDDGEQTQKQKYFVGMPLGISLKAS